MSQSKQLNQLEIILRVIFVILPDQQSYRILYQSTRRLLALENIKNNRFTEFTDSDREKLKNYLEVSANNIHPQLLACLSHIYFLTKGRQINHLNIGREAYQGHTNLADLIFDFLVDQELISQSIAPRRISDPRHAFWNKNPSGPVPIMSLKEIWSISCQQGRADRMANQKVLWDSITAGLNSFFLLGMQSDRTIVSDHSFEKIWSQNPPTNQDLGPFYLVRAGEEYKIKCPNPSCGEYALAKDIIDGRCPSCALQNCHKCGSLTDPKSMGEDGCDKCKGKIQCPTCARWIEVNELRDVGSGQKCSSCINQVQCPRCGQFDEEDRVRNSDCDYCRGKEQCSKCYIWVDAGSLVDGECNDCRTPRIPERQSTCPTCKSPLDEDGVCPNCPLTTTPAKVLIRGLVNPALPHDFIDYVLIPIVSHPDYEQMKVEFSIKVTIKKPQGDWDNDLLSQIKQSIAQLQPPLTYEEE